MEKKYSARFLLLFSCFATLLAVIGCASPNNKASIIDSYGPEPSLPAPKTSLIPTLGQRSPLIMKPPFKDGYMCLEFW